MLLILVISTVGLLLVSYALGIVPGKYVIQTVVSIKKNIITGLTVAIVAKHYNSGAGTK